jgi:hypothetical protein
VSHPSKSALLRASESKPSLTIKPPSYERNQAQQETESIAESRRPADVRKSKNIVSPAKLKDKKPPHLKNLNVNAN